MTKVAKMKGKSLYNKFSLFARPPLPPRFIKTSSATEVNIYAPESSSSLPMQISLLREKKEERNVVSVVKKTLEAE